MGLWITGAHWGPALAAPLLWVVARRLGHPGVGLVAAGAAGLATALLRPPDATVDFIAVGQGDAVLVRGGGRAVLVDTGPPEAGAHLASHLWREGVGHLDRVVITHAHPDHLGGLEAVARAVSVGEVWTHGRPTTGPTWRRARAALGTTPIRGAPPEGLALGALRLEVLLTDAPAALEENDASVALRVVGPGGSVVLTGDLEAAGEARLLAVLPPPVPPVVLKAPHHGSRTSSGPALLAAVAPEAVVFTTGRDNRYHFPHAEVQARYHARGISTWNTGTEGWVRVELGASRIETRARAAPLRVAWTERWCREVIPRVVVH